MTADRRAMASWGFECPAGGEHTWGWLEDVHGRLHAACEECHASRLRRADPDDGDVAPVPHPVHCPHGHVVRWRYADDPDRIDTRLAEPCEQCYPADSNDPF